MPFRRIVTCIVGLFLTEVLVGQASSAKPFDSGLTGARLSVAGKPADTGNDDPASTSLPHAEASSIDVPQAGVAGLGAVDSNLGAAESPTIDMPSKSIGKVRKEPLQGFLKRDAAGTPLIPDWKMQAGKDVLLGKFYVGILGVKLAAVDNPNWKYVVLGHKKLAAWKGAKPAICLVKLTRLTDGSNGFYFQTRSSPDGPRGWFIPQGEPVPHKAREWAIYYLQ